MTQNNLALSLAGESIFMSISLPMDLDTMKQYTPIVHVEKETNSKYYSQK